LETFIKKIENGVITHLKTLNGKQMCSKRKRPFAPNLNDKFPMDLEKIKRHIESEVIRTSSICEGYGIGCFKNATQGFLVKLQEGYYHKDIAFDLSTNTYQATSMQIPKLCQMEIFIEDHSFSLLIAVMVSLGFSYAFYDDRIRQKMKDEAEFFSGEIYKDLQKEPNFLTTNQIIATYNLKKTSPLWQLIKLELSRIPSIQSTQSQVGEDEIWRYNVSFFNQQPSASN